MPTRLRQRWTEHRVEQLVGNLLQAGVFGATLLVFVGGVLYLKRHALEAPDYQVFRGEPAMFRTPDGVVSAVLAGRRRGMIQLGLMLLVATPIARVFVALLVFVRQRDRIYMVVTLTVLTGLIVSLLQGHS